jgi:hypothetical protein
MRIVLTERGVTLRIHTVRFWLRICLHLNSTNVTNGMAVHSPPGGTPPPSPSPACVNPRGAGKSPISFAALVKRVNLSRKRTFCRVLLLLERRCRRWTSFRAKREKNWRFLDDFKQKHGLASHNCSEWTILDMRARQKKKFCKTTCTDATAVEEFRVLRVLALRIRTICKFVCISKVRMSSMVWIRSQSVGNCQRRQIPKRSERARLVWLIWLMWLIWLTWLICLIWLIDNLIDLIDLLDLVTWLIWLTSMTWSIWLIWLVLLLDSFATVIQRRYFVKLLIFRNIGRFDCSVQRSECWKSSFVCRMWETSALCVAFSPWNLARIRRPEKQIVSQ